ncbi:MAG: OmpA family protein, partial [Phycisphaerales bacterium]
SYDADRGMLRFASDLTFGSGSDALSDEAKRSIRQLAEVLKGAGAQYDVDIVGHTDNVPIGNPATRERHPTNMHLSVHRAISVRNELRSAGVTAEKMRASGWGEHRPIVANNPSGGTVQNRRVEIYLTRGGWTGPSATPALASPERRTEPTRQQPTRTRDDADIVK